VAYLVGVNPVAQEGGDHLLHVRRLRAVEVGGAAGADLLLAQLHPQEKSTGQHQGIPSLKT